MPQFSFTYGQSLAVLLLLAEILRLGVPEGNEPGIGSGKFQRSVGALQFAAFRLKRFDPSSKLEQGLLRPVGLPRRFGSLFDQ